MSNRKAKNRQTPTVEQMEAELKRIRYRKQYVSTLRSTVATFIVVASIVVLAVMLLPVFRITGSSMAPALNPGEIVVTMRTTDVHRGDLLVLNTINRKTLVKRVIGMPGDEIDIDNDGVVYVNGSRLAEPYVSGQALGQCDIDLPYIVPEARYFVMGDQREISLDSRSTAIGCVAQEQVVGVVAARIWPMENFDILIDR